MRDDDSLSIVTLKVCRARANRHCKDRTAALRVVEGQPVTGRRDTDSSFDVFYRVVIDIVVSLLVFDYGIFPS